MEELTESSAAKPGRKKRQPAKQDSLEVRLISNYTYGSVQHSNNDVLVLESEADFNPRTMRWTQRENTQSQAPKSRQGTWNRAMEERAYGGSDETDNNLPPESAGVLR